MNIYLKYSIYACWAVLIVWILFRLFRFESACQILFWTMRSQLKSAPIYMFNHWTKIAEEFPDVAIRVLEKFQAIPMHKRKTHDQTFIDMAEQYVIDNDLRYEL